jgi:hypothetical protein
VDHRPGALRGRSHAAHVPEKVQERWPPTSAWECHFERPVNAGGHGWAARGGLRGIVLSAQSAAPAAWLGRQAPTGLVPSGRATADLIMHEVEPPLSWRPEGQANASDETSIPDIINEHHTRSLGLRCSFDPADEILM